MKRALNLRAVACVAIALALAGAGASVVQAAGGGNPILNECQSGRLTHNYTLSQLRHALAIMPASVKQYSSCVDVINQAILTVSGGGHTGTGGGGGSFLPTPVIVILVLLILIAVTFGALAIRRRRGGARGGPGDGDPPAGTGPPSPVEQ